jgi:lipopolysaccharide transport protein LptA
MGRSETSGERTIFRAAAWLALLGPALTWAAMAATRAEVPGQPEISWDAASVDGDFKTHMMHLKDVVIKYGTMTVRADKADATGTDFQNSHWTFEGNVRINAEPRGNLRSDEAVVEFHDNHLVKATVTGKPAEFEQKRADSDQIARGRANEIVYEVNDETVRLSDDAWLSDGQNEISGPVLVYNLREEHVQATTAPGTGQRVHITITPRDNSTTNKPPASGPNRPQPPASAPESNKSEPKPQPTAPPPSTAPQHP